MQRKWLIALLGVLVLTVAAVNIARIRMPVAAGLFYPAQPDALYAAARVYIDQAKVPDIPGRYLACVAPHSAFPYSGAVAGHAFKPLKAGQYDRVIILASSHFASFRGCSVPAVQFLRTPLGDVELDGPAIRKLEWNTLIEMRSVSTRSTRTFSDGSQKTPLHEVEYSIELVLPFLQAQLGQFKVVPIIVGEFIDYQGELDVPALEAVAETLREIVDDRTFIVASSDFTHFGNAYGFRPYNTADPELIGQLDADAFEPLLAHSAPGFEHYMKESDNTICGSGALDLLMRVLPRGTRGVLLDYRISASVTGSQDTSVSYGALAFYNPDLPPAEVKVVKKRVVTPPSEAQAQPLTAAEAQLSAQGNAAARSKPAEAKEKSAAPKEAPKKKSEKGGLFRIFKKGDK